MVVPKHLQGLQTFCSPRTLPGNLQVILDQRAGPARPSGGPPPPAAAKWSRLPSSQGLRVMERRRPPIPESLPLKALSPCRSCASAPAGATGPGPAFSPRSKPFSPVRGNSGRSGWEVDPVEWRGPAPPSACAVIAVLADYEPPPLSLSVSLIALGTGNGDEVLEPDASTRPESLRNSWLTSGG